MKLGRLFILALVAPSVFCQAQDKESTDKPVQPAAPAIQAPPAAAALASGAAADTYIIGPSDEISVNVWKEPTLSGTLLVRPDGMISLPLVGDIQA